MPGLIIAVVVLFVLRGLATLLIGGLALTDGIGLVSIGLVLLGLSTLGSAIGLMSRSNGARGFAIGQEWLVLALVGLSFASAFTAIRPGVALFAAGLLGVPTAALSVFNLWALRRKDAVHYFDPFQGMAEEVDGWA
ncbi:MAG: hypothetical protein AAGE52_17675 [Myxococcota bacterium]